MFKLERANSRTRRDCAERAAAGAQRKKSPDCLTTWLMSGDAGGSRGCGGFGAGFRGAACARGSVGCSGGFRVRFRGAACARRSGVCPRIRSRLPGAVRSRGCVGFPGAACARGSGGGGNSAVGFPGACARARGSSRAEDRTRCAFGARGAGAEPIAAPARASPPGAEQPAPRALQRTAPVEQSTAPAPRRSAPDDAAAQTEARAAPGVRDRPRTRRAARSRQARADGAGAAAGRPAGRGALRAIRGRRPRRTGLAPRDPHSDPRSAPSKPRPKPRRPGYPRYRTSRGTRR